MEFEYYLSNENKQQMEGLVRKLGVLISSQKQTQFNRIYQTTVQQSTFTD